MAKFTAQSLMDLLVEERSTGRVERRKAYAVLDTRFSHVVACEASDGSWCEFDAENFDHAKRLAENAVWNLGARGCSVWAVDDNGRLGRGPSLYRIFAEVDDD